jgi:IS6 family transposase
VEVTGVWRYVYRAADQHGQVIDVLVSSRHHTNAAKRFFTAVIGVHGESGVVTTDRSPVLVRAIVEVLHHPRLVTDQGEYANNRVEADHARVKARLRPLRGLKRDRAV